MKQTIKLLFISILFSSAVMAQKSTNVEILDLNKETFKQKVWNFEKDKSVKRIGDLPIILDFHATWCRPCKMLAPHLQAIQNKYKGKLIIYRIDVDQEAELAQRFNVQAMPTVVFMNKTSYKSELGYKEYEELEAVVKTNFFSKK